MIPGTLLPRTNEKTTVVCFLLGNYPAQAGRCEQNSTHIYLPMKMEWTECSETLAYKLDAG